MCFPPTKILQLVKIHAKVVKIHVIFFVFYKDMWYKETCFQTNNKDVFYKETCFLYFPPAQILQLVKIHVKVLQSYFWHKYVFYNDKIFVKDFKK